MSPKELLYIEDALGHDKQIKCTCQNSAETLSDKELSNFVTDIGARHAKIFNNFYKLVGGSYAG